jgi:curved DNA-binding protein CbpA
MLNKKNHYEVLGIEPEAKPNEIKEAGQRNLALAKQEYEKKNNNYKKAYSVLTQKNTSADLRKKAATLLGLDNTQVDADIVRQVTQEAVKSAKMQYERRTNEIKTAFSILGNEEKREVYDNQLLLQQEQAKRREKASKQAKLAKARNERKKGSFLASLLRWILFLLLVAILVKLYFDNQTVVHEWLANIGLSIE